MARIDKEANQLGKNFPAAPPSSPVTQPKTARAFRTVFGTKKSEVPLKKSHQYALKDPSQAHFHDQLLEKMIKTLNQRS